MESRSIGQQLPKVGVVGPLQLVLDEYPSITCYVFTENIGTEWPN